MQQVTNIKINLARPYAPVIVYAKQNDSLTRYIYIELWDNNTVYTIPSEAVATVMIGKPDGTEYYDDATIDNNIIQVRLRPEALTSDGTARVDIVLYAANNERLTAFTFDIIIEKTVMNSGRIQSSDYYKALTNMTSQVIATSTAIKILGYYDTYEDLAAGVIAPAAGDMYGVGTSEPYDIYIYDGVSEAWVNNGNLGSTVIPYAGESSGSPLEQRLPYFNVTLRDGYAFIFTPNHDLIAGATLSVGEDGEAYPLLMRDGTALTDNAVYESVPVMVVYRDGESPAYIIAWDGRHIGNMDKSVYDMNNNGYVDVAESTTGQIYIMYCDTAGTLQELKTFNGSEDRFIRVYDESHWPTKLSDFSDDIGCITAYLQDDTLVLEKGD